MACILLVEDDVIFREGLVDLLSDAGHWVHSAGSGEEALTWSRKGHQLDLVLADVRMAGMDGIAAFQELRRERPGLRGIIMTGYASTDAPRRAVHAGVWDYLYKPFGTAELLQAIEQVLHGVESEESSRGLLAGWVESARRFLRTTLGLGLEQQRLAAFRAFYAGVRSHFLGPKDALMVWDELERIDEQYRVLADEDMLEAEYGRVCKLIQGLSAGNAVLYHEVPRKHGQVDPQAFRILFDRILEGKVPPHLLPVAPFLRLLDPQLAQANGELHAMVRLVWS